MSPSTAAKTNGSKDDEYTDYSCSTSIERLARDVETLLREWHVDKGNDRHISMTRSTTNGAPKNSGNYNNNASCAGSVTSQMSQSTSATTQTNSTTPSSTLLLRSDVLVWNVSLTTPTGRLVSFTVELQLSLWDGPSENNENNNAEGNSGLPHSLRRSAQLQPMAAAVFENMSHLFGIGQHITLTPKHQNQHFTPSSNASIASTSSSHTMSLFDNVQVGGDLQFLAQTIVGRHDDEITARWALYQVLSGWLQTALNSAVANCHCCIPVFGFWGSYQPDLFQHTKRQLRKKSRSPISADDYLSIYPSWMHDILQLDLPGLPRMTRKQYMEIQDQQNKQYLPPILTAGVLPTLHTGGQFSCSVVPCAPHTPSRLTLWGNLLLQHCPSPADTVVLWTARHVFAWWKPPLVKATAFQMLFQPDNFQYDSEHNPYTAWRRKPTPQDETGASRISIRKTSQKQSQQIIDLTGDETGVTQQFPYGHHHAGDADSAMELYVQKLDGYQDECRALAISLLDQAAGSTASEPRWGPIDDPVASVHATVTWNGSPQPQGSTTTVQGQNRDASGQHQQSENNPTSPPPRQPLLSFPLRIRSKHTMSTADWVEMEESVERTILDPLAGAPSCQFQVQTWWDLETPVASLAATQQCILAALIRTSTLPDETLLKHLTDDAVLEQWDNESGNVVAACLATQAQVSASTRAIVDAMDWITSAEDKMDLRDAEVLVRHILSPDNGSNFPPPPTSPLANADGHPTTPTAPRRRRSSLVEAASARESISSPASLNSNKAGANSNDISNNFAPLFKSAPIGRLVSILCVHLARVRSPCSMAMLWMAFCHEVRVRWEHRLALPHMNHVPGLDPSSLEMKERNRCLTTLGVKAEQAAYWHGPPLSKSSSAVVQPDTEFPGDHHCLIGQKLQVR